MIRTEHEAESPELKKKVENYILKNYVTQSLYLQL